MNTKLLMSASAFVLGVIGAGLTFLPEELLGYIVAEPNDLLLLMVQALGAAYLGFGFLNWMAKGGVIGGIYNRPIAIGNLMHFTLVAITLLKFTFSSSGEPGTNSEYAMILWALTAVYVILAVSFYWVVFAKPKLQ